MNAKNKIWTVIFDVPKLSIEVKQYKYFLHISGIEHKENSQELEAHFYIFHLRHVLGSWHNEGDILVVVYV